MTNITVSEHNELVITAAIPLADLGLAKAVAPAGCATVHCDDCDRDVAYQTAFQYVVIPDNGRMYRTYVCERCLKHDIDCDLDDIHFGDADPNTEVPALCGECEVAGYFCDVIADKECFACGMPACDPCCIIVDEYYEYGKQRICFSCYEEHYPATAEDDINQKLFSMILT